MVVLAFRPSVKQRLEDERVLLERERREVHSRQERIVLIEEKALQLEQQLRGLRGAIAEMQRCTCPVGWGSTPAPDCRQHRGA